MSTDVEPLRTVISLFLDRILNTTQYGLPPDDIWTFGHLNLDLKSLWILDLASHPSSEVISRPTSFRPRNRPRVFHGVRHLLIFESSS